MKTDGLDLQNYLNKDIQCSCGKMHSTVLKEIDISAGALENIPHLVQKNSYTKVFLVADTNTYKAAGERVYSLLEKAAISTMTFIFDDKELIPDENAIGKILMALDRDTDLIITVGSGTLNDIGKFVSFKLAIDYFIVATAPSMDGFASNVSAMITNRLKTTYETHVPKAIIGDLDILKEAPMKMIAAGVGDILGKYVCLLDWKIAHLIQGEYHCEYIENMMRQAIEAVMAGAKNIKKRDPKAIQSIMEGLVLSGIAMSFAGNSRPASGSEHHLSHYWEMMFLFQDRAPVLHGTKVGIGTIVAIKLYEMLRTSQIDFKVAAGKAAQFKQADWEEQIRLVYGPVAEDVIRFEKSAGKNATENVVPRIGVLEQNWKQILSLIETNLPSASSLIEVLQNIDAPTAPEQVGIDQKMLTDSIKYAKEIRNRYGLLQILFDLDLPVGIGNF